MNEQQRLLVKQSIESQRPDTDALCDAFYRELFARKPELERLFPPAPAARRAKFNGMMAAFDNVKHLDKIAPAIVALGARHARYGVAAEDYPVGRAAFMAALSAVRGAELPTAERDAWQALFDTLLPLMTRPPEPRDRAAYEEADRRLRPGESVLAVGMLEAVGGREAVERVHRRFYDTIFEDAWLGRFFFGKSEDALVKKQTDFMVACFGGINDYRGEPPGIAHMHMLITDEMLDLRETMLRDAILAEGLSPEIADRWIAVDATFRSAIVKRDAGQCITRCMGQVPIVVPKPAGYRWRRGGDRADR